MFLEIQYTVSHLIQLKGQQQRHKTGTDFRTAKEKMSFYIYLYIHELTILQLQNIKKKMFLYLNYILLYC